jgi:hypothetical protein
MIKFFSMVPVLQRALPVQSCTPNIYVNILVTPPPTQKFPLPPPSLDIFHVCGMSGLLVFPINVELRAQTAPHCVFFPSD